MSDMDPFTQNVTFLLADGETEVRIPMGLIDAFHSETASVCINYGAQLGASLIMLLTILILTPSSKFRRASNLLHIFGLLICTIRMTLLSLYFPSPFNEFYAYWARDYSRVPQSEYGISIAANTFSFLLVIVVEAALVNQAWTMVSLWPSLWKHVVSVTSVIITLLTIGWRLAFTVIQNQAVLNLNPPEDFRWVIYCMVAVNCVSICWYCAIFNAKLVIHLVSNRGVLPSYKNLTPMEILIMTNGILMIVPVIFSGLEWGRFKNFESASLTLTSVAIILPLGTLAAQRMANTKIISYDSSGASGRYEIGSGTANSRVPLKTASFTSYRTGTTPQVSILSRCEAGVSSRERMVPAGVEMGRLHSETEVDGGHVCIDRTVVQHEERLDERKPARNNDFLA